MFGDDGSARAGYYPHQDRRIHPQNCPTPYEPDCRIGRRPATPPDRSGGRLRESGPPFPPRPAGNGSPKKTIGAYGLPSPAVHSSHTLLRSVNLVSCAANACMDKNFMQPAGEHERVPSPPHWEDDRDISNRALAHSLVDRPGGCNVAVAQEQGERVPVHVSLECRMRRERLQLGPEQEHAVLPAVISKGRCASAREMDKGRPGCTGTITGAGSNPSGMCLRLHSRHTTIADCESRRWLPDSGKSPSETPGAVQLEKEEESR